MTEYSIGELAQAGGIKVQTVRYYERIGLLPQAPRSAGGQRRFDTVARDRLTFIRHARELGFSLDAVRELLDLADRPGRPCERADAIARRQLDAVERRLARLDLLRTELSRMVETCGSDTVEGCRVIETLSDHALCATEHPPVGEFDALR